MKLISLARFFLVIFFSFASLLAQAENTHVLIKTNQGDIVIELENDKAPISVDNFLTYVQDKHYDGTIFHRVIKNFMIQGGGMDENRMMKPMRAPIKNEANNGLKNARGTIAMARTNQVDSATSQFFINVKDNTFLDHGARDFGYAVFGKVIKGMEVVDKIAALPTTSMDEPRQTVLIESASVLAHSH